MSKRRAMTLKIPLYIGLLMSSIYLLGRISNLRVLPICVSKVVLSRLLISSANQMSICTSWVSTITFFQRKFAYQRVEFWTIITFCTPTSLWFTIPAPLNTFLAVLELACLSIHLLFPTSTVFTFPTAIVFTVRLFQGTLWRPGRKLIWPNRIILRNEDIWGA